MEIGLYHVSSGSLTDGDQIVRLVGTTPFWYEFGNGFAYVDFPHISTTFPKSEPEMVAEAIHNYYNQNQVDNLLNFVEFDQTVNLVRSLLSKKAFVNAFLGRGHGVGASNAILGYSFGVAPLWSDLQKMYKSMSKFRQDLKRSIAAQKGDKVVHSKFSGNSTLETSGLAYYGNPLTPDSSLWHASLSGDTLRHVTVRGRWNINFSTDLFKGLDYSLRRFLSAGPATFAWEHLPFSFVVDWFVDLSSVLDKGDQLLTGSSAEIKDICVSTKRDLTVTCYKHDSVQNPCSINGEFAHVKLTDYHRKSVLQDTNIKESGRFGKKQAVLTAALIRQLAAKRR
jgi:hypothetical protein